MKGENGRQRRDATDAGCSGVGFVDIRRERCRSKRW